MAQQLANAVGGVMSGAAQGMNQPILIPFNTGGHLGGQQGLVLSLPTANIQSLVAAAAAGGIMTLPLQNLQGKHEGTEGNRNKTLKEELWVTLRTHRHCMVNSNQWREQGEQPLHVDDTLMLIVAWHTHESKTFIFKSSEHSS